MYFLPDFRLFFIGITTFLDKRDEEAELQKNVNEGLRGIERLEFARDRRTTGLLGLGDHEHQTTPEQRAVSSAG